MKWRVSHANSAASSISHRGAHTKASMRGGARRKGHGGGRDRVGDVHGSLFQRDGGRLKKEGALRRSRREGWGGVRSRWAGDVGAGWTRTNVPALIDTELRERGMSAEQRTMRDVKRSQNTAGVLDSVLHAHSRARRVLKDRVDSEESRKRSYSRRRRALRHGTTTGRKAAERHGHVRVLGLMLQR